MMTTSDRAHMNTCNVPNAGGCYRPSCGCWCHRPPYPAPQPVHELPKPLRGIAPSIGSQWVWEPYKDHARCLLTVTDVTWNGDECWVETEDIEGGKAWNPLDRWVEATVFWRSAEGED